MIMRTTNDNISNRIKTCIKIPQRIESRNHWVAKKTLKENLRQPKTEWNLVRYRGEDSSQVGSRVNTWMQNSQESLCLPSHSPQLGNVLSHPVKNYVEMRRYSTGSIIVLKFSAVPGTVETLCLISPGLCPWHIFPLLIWSVHFHYNKP